MLYKEYPVNALLWPYVETYWVGDGFASEGEWYKVLPDGCVDVVFSVDRAENACRVGIVGTMTTFLRVNARGSTRMFGIRFRPAGITAFTRVPVGEFTDKHVELALVETLFGDDFYEILYDFYEMPPGFHEALSEQWLARGIFQRLDDFLVSRLDRLYQPDRQVARAVELICRARGGLSMSAVASDVCLCQRHFERKFRRAIGITPKMFARVARFTRAARCLQGRPRGDLLSVAVECGYYDHAHLIKEFKMLSGDVPGAPRG